MKKSRLRNITRFIGVFAAVNMFLKAIVGIWLLTQEFTWVRLELVSAYMLCAAALGVVFWQLFLLDQVTEFLNQRQAEDLKQLYQFSNKHELNEE